METRGPSQPDIVAIGAGRARSGAEAPGGGPRAGAVVSLRVLEGLGGDLYRIAAGPQSFTARSERPLAAGSVFPARVLRREGALVFQPLPSRRSSVGSPPAASGFPSLPVSRNDAAALAAPDRAILAALLREGVRPSAESVERLRRALRRAGSPGVLGDEEASVDLAARMEAKGLPAADTAIDAILTGADGRQGHGGHDHGGRRERPEERKESRAPAGEGGATVPIAPDMSPVDASRALSLDVPEGELPALLGALIRGIVFRSGGEGTLLNLFNHAKGPDGGWIYAPFDFELDSIAFAGMIRLRLPRIAGGPGRIEADFAARREGGERRWSFGLDFGGGRPRLVLRCDEDEAMSASLSRLGEFRVGLAASGRQVEVSMAEGNAAPGDVDVEA